jgi:hypothetical protein
VIGGSTSHQIHSAFRLNTRETIRDRSTSDKLDNAYSLASMRIEPQSGAYGSKQRGVTVTVQHDSTISEFDHTTRPTFEESKSV